MYTPSHFAETDSEKLLSLIRDNPLATLVVASGSELVVNHIPFVPDVVDGEIVGLRAHVPRANPVSSILQSTHNCAVIFHGPAGYISPSWYETKKIHGKVVPTWNYAVVHIHGLISIQDDAEWVMTQIQDLTEQKESERKLKWSTSDAPEEFTARLIKMLVGLEVSVSRIEGKTKASQNQPKENQLSILNALSAEAPESDLRAMMNAAFRDAWE